MRRLALAALVILVAAAPLFAAQGPDPKAAELRQKLVASIDRIAADLDGVMGYSIVDLTSGDRIERLPSAVFATASTIKLAILYELFKQSDEGKLSLDTVRPLDPKQVVGGTGVLAELTAPALSLRDYAILMVVLSDNTATNVLIDTVGMSNVTARMTALGLKDTKLRRKMIDLAAARRGDENVSTPAEITRLLEILYRGDGLKKESQEALLAILKKPKTTALRRAIPSGVAVANKPGTLEGVEVDAGIVYLQGRPYAVTVMTTYLTQNAAGETAITAVSQAAFDYFNRLAKSSEYGRSIR
ncbi:MAG TPA: serine hydrolase [Vicinamibacterales bacterium]